MGSTEWLLDFALREGPQAVVEATGLWLWETECVTHIDGRRFLNKEMRKARDYPDGYALRFNVPSDGSMCEELSMYMAGTSGVSSSLNADVSDNVNLKRNDT